MFVACTGVVNVFEVFLPQLLTYPNPQDPLNSEAASLLNRDKAQYEQKVKGMANFVFICFIYHHIQFKWIL